MRKSGEVALEKLVSKIHCHHAQEAIINGEEGKKEKKRRKSGEEGREEDKTVYGGSDGSVVPAMLAVTLSSE